MNFSSYYIWYEEGDIYSSITISALDSFEGSCYLLPVASTQIHTKQETLHPYQKDGEPLNFLLNLCWVLLSWLLGHKLILTGGVQNKSVQVTDTSIFQHWLHLFAAVDYII